MAKTIEDYKKDYAAAKAAGDAAGMKAANDGANAIRSANGQKAEYATQDIANVAANSAQKSTGSSGGSSAPSPTWGGSATGVGIYTDIQQSIKDQMNANSKAWHTADAATKKQLEAANKALAAQLGGSVSFDSKTGTWSGAAEQPLINNQYNSQYSPQIDSLLNAIINREPFSYDYKTDPSYLAYEQQYKRLGDRAREDTLGDVAALNGGYASSWATTAASQAQNDYNSQLSGIIPQLYDAAYNRYLDEDSLKRSDLGLLMDIDNMNYDRFRDTVGDSKWETEFKYNQGRDDVADSQWQQTFDWNKTVDQWNMSNTEATQKFEQMMSKWQLTGVADAEVAEALGVPVGATTESYYFNKADQALQQAKLAASKSSGSGSGSGNSTNNKNNYEYSKSKDLILREARQTVIDTGSYKEAAKTILKNVDVYGLGMEDYFKLCKEMGVDDAGANNVWIEYKNEYIASQNGGSGEKDYAYYAAQMGKASDPEAWLEQNKYSIPFDIYSDLYQLIGY